MKIQAKQLRDHLKSIGVKSNVRTKRIYRGMRNGKALYEYDSAYSVLSPKTNEETIEKLLELEKILTHNDGDFIWREINVYIRRLDSGSKVIVVRS